MYIDIVPNRNAAPAVLLREGWREGGKVCKRTLADLTAWPTRNVELLRRRLRDEPLLAPKETLAIERSLPHGQVEAVLALIRHRRLETRIGAKRGRERDRVVAMIIERLIDPCSKRATPRAWHTTPLAETLEVEEADEEDLYAAMDGRLARQGRIERELAARHLGDGAPVPSAVSSRYDEGPTGPWVRFGHSRGHQPGRPIIVYGVLTDAEGRPVAVPVYPGNTADPSTVPDQVETRRGRFGLRRVVLVGDRGLLTRTPIDTLREHPGMGWISAPRSEKARALAEEGTPRRSRFDGQNLAEIHSPAFAGERWVACFHPLLAEERRRQREAWLAATEAARRNKTERLPAEDLPVHRFRTRMAERATRCRHPCRLKTAPDTPQIRPDTQPTLLPSRALELIRWLSVTGH